jgi:hypothetical protein
MTGGRTKLARYFGTTLAAAFQRLIDRSAFDHDFVARSPEALFTPQPLVEWMLQNRRIEKGPRHATRRRRLGGRRDIAQ